MMSGIRPPLPAAALARNREYVFHAHELVGEASGNRGVTRTILWMRSMEERGALVSYALFCLRSARHVVTMQIRQAINTQEAGPIIYLGRSRQPSEGHLFHSMQARDSFLHTNRCRIAELIVLGG
jgi:hypothetical protein